MVLRRLPGILCHRIYAILVLVVSAATVSAQSSGYWHLSDADGLPSNTIYHIIEGHDGHIYLGTAAGLVQFNGFTFKTIENPTAKAADASDLHADSKGNLWFSNFNHELFRYDSTGKMTKMSLINFTNFNAQGKFLLDMRDNVWFFNPEKFCRLDVSKMAIQSWEHKVGLFTFNNYGRDGIVYGLAELNLLQFGNQYPNWKVTPFAKLDISKKLNKTIILFDQEAHFVFASNYALISKTGRFKTLDLSQFPQIKSVLNYGMLRDGTIWVATNNGFMLFDNNGDPLLNGNLMLEGKNISYVYQDSRNNYWVASLDEGLFMINNFDIRTWNFYTQTHKLNGVFSIYSNDNNMLLGMQDGTVIQMDEKYHTTPMSINGGRWVYFMTRIPENGSYVVNDYYFANINSQGHAVVNLSAPRGLYCEADEVLYSNNSGFRRTKLAKLGGADSEPLPLNVTLEQRNQRNQVTSQKQTEIGTRILEGRGGRLYRDSKHRIWISSSNGIYYFQRKEKKLVQIVLQHNENAMCTDFAESESGTIYMAIANVGIVEWNENGLKSLYTPSNGLLSPNVRRLIWAGNRVWAASAKGLNAVDPASHKVYDYRISDGLASNDIQDIASFSGKIWVATFKGLNSIPLDFISENPNAPVLNLNQVLVNGKDFSFNKGALMSLKSDENNIEFRFEGINFRSRNLLYYMYRLTGQNDNWIRLPGNTNHVLFQGLPAGNYVFEIKAFNDKNSSGNAIIRIPFQVTEPFWKKGWFWIATVLLLAGAGFWGFRKKQADKLKKDRLENELRLSQLTSLKAQMNPHFMFNALNSIQDFILLNDKSSANIYLGKFSDLMRMVLDMSNQTHITLSNELKALNLYLELEALRFEDSLEYKVNIDENLDLSDWKIPSMIVQPFVENAIKHGLLHKRNNRRLTIDFAKPGDAPVLVVTIADNGIGRKEAERINNTRGNRHTSFATGATQRRLQLLNLNNRDNIKIVYNDLADDNGNAAGTSVQIQIPLTSVTAEMANQPNDLR